MTTIKLKYPVTDNNLELSELTIRRPKVSDIIYAENLTGSEAQKEVQLFANLTTQSPKTIEKLDLLDYKQLQETYADFLS